MVFGLNIFYSGIKYTEKDWVQHKVRLNPLQRPPWALVNISVTGAQFAHRWYYLVTIIITHRHSYMSVG